MKEKTKPLNLDFDKLMEAFFLTYKSFNPNNWDKFWESYKETEIIKDIKLIFELYNKKIKSACEFWLKYKDNPELLLEEYPEYEEKVKEIEKEAYQKEFYMEFVKNYFLEKYNEWLFKLAFKDVLEEGE